MYCREREIVLSLAGHFKLFAGHLIEFNYSSSPDISKIRWTCPASPVNFAYSAVLGDTVTVFSPNCAGSHDVVESVGSSSGFAAIAPTDYDLSSVDITQSLQSTNISEAG